MARTEEARPAPPAPSRGGPAERVRSLPRPNPVWGKAPWVLWRYPAVLFSLVVSSAILALAAATGPLFLSSAGSAAVGRVVSGASRWGGGLTVVAFGDLGGSSSTSGLGLLSRRSSFLDQSVGKATGIGSQVLNLEGPKVLLSIPGSKGAEVVAQPLSRTGFLGHVSPVGTTGGASGMWLPSSAARAMGGGPGDAVSVSSGNRTATVRVAGVYRDLTAGPLAEWWSPLADQIQSVKPGAPLPPVIVLLSPGAMSRLTVALHQAVRFTWQFPLASVGTLSQERRLASRLRSVEANLSDQANQEAQSLFSGATVQVGLPDLVASANSVVDSVKGPVGSLSVAARVVGLAVIAAAGAYSIRRRRVEMEVLSAHGAGPVGLGARSVAESVFPVAGGAALGLGAALFLVGAFGPGGAIDPSANGSALTQVIITAVVSLVAIGVVGGVAAARRAEEREESRAQELAARTPWEIVVLVLAAASYAEIVVRGNSGPSSGEDALILMFPILFVGGLAGLAGRALIRLAPRLRRAGRRWPAALYLASRRVASATRLTVLVIAAASVALGVLAYAGTLVVSTNASDRAKAIARNGSETRAVLSPNVPEPAGLPFPVTVVDRIAGARVLPTDRAVGVLAVDPGTILSAAIWSEGLAGSSAHSVVAALGPSGPGGLKVVPVGGGLPAGATLDLAGNRIPIRAAATAEAFPGVRSGRTSIVVDRSSLERILRSSGTTLGGVNGSREVWARTGATRLAAAMAARSAPLERITTLAGALNDPRFLAERWTFGLLEGLGVLSGVLALVGVILYVQARRRAREVSYALATRMGLRRRSHFLSNVMELGAILAVAFVLGTVCAELAVRLTIARVDLTPQLPPPPFLRVPAGLLIGTAGVLALASVLGGWLVQRDSERAHVAEVMRLAG